MTVRELRQKLFEMDQDAEVVVRDFRDGDPVFADVVDNDIVVQRVTQSGARWFWESDPIKSPSVQSKKVVVIA